MNDRKMTDKQRKAFHAHQDMKVRCFGCGRRVEPEINEAFDDDKQDLIYFYACPMCGEEIEPRGKWDKDV